MFIILLYHILIQNGGLLLFLLPLSAAIAKAAITSGAAASGTHAEKKIVDEITDSLNAT